MGVTEKNIWSLEEDGMKAIPEEAATADFDLSRKVYVDGSKIVLAEGGSYEISLARCNTYEKITRWSLHLAEKNWMTLEVLNRFILLAIKGNELEIPSMP